MTKIVTNPEVARNTVKGKPRKSIPLDVPLSKALETVENQLIEVEMTQNAITQTGMFEINRLIQGKLGIPGLPENWVWEWEITKKNPSGFVGNFPKRVANYARKTYGLKVTPETVSEIGNIAKANSNDFSLYYLDFTRSLNWYAGAFGDFRSCFWTERPEAKQMLLDHGVYAMRLWDSPEYAQELCLGNFDHPHDDYANEARGTYSMETRNGNNVKDGLWGYARAWLVPDIPKANCAVVFNSYPKNLGLIVFARLLGHLVGQPYRHIRLENFGSEHENVMFINSGSGYAVGDTELGKASAPYYDLHWEMPPFADCYRCGDPIQRRERYWTDPTLMFPRYYCHRCCQITWRCNVCDRVYESEEEGNASEVVSFYVQHPRRYEDALSRTRVDYSSYTVCGRCLTRPEAMFCSICQRCVWVERQSERRRFPHTYKTEDGENKEIEVEICYGCFYSMSNAISADEKVVRSHGSDVDIHIDYELDKNGNYAISITDVVRDGESVLESLERRQ